MQIVRLSLMVLLTVPTISSCASGQSRSKSDADVVAQNYIAANCKKFVLNGARVDAEDYGEEIVITMVPGDIDEAERQAKQLGGFLLDPEIIFLFKKNPLKILGVRGCRKYA
ncbi:hypothetical protein [Inquilinus limosus]|uniref:hypothetical protein n=1 Tax=Inquilinus limosus TaxID=171674 RepID=UPI0012DE3276|nr:hypothetical protein [Inquilinus limosus]